MVPCIPTGSPRPGLGLTVVSMDFPPAPFPAVLLTKEVLGGRTVEPHNWGTSAQGVHRTCEVVGGATQKSGKK